MERRMIGQKELKNYIKFLESKGKFEPSVLGLCTHNHQEIKKITQNILNIYLRSKN